MNFDRWKEAGMIYNRFNPVKKHYELKQRIRDAQTIDDMRVIMSALLEAALPVSRDEQILWEQDQ